MPKHSTPTGLPDSKIHEIKTLLWDGKKQKNICILTKTSQSTVSRILNGTLGENVPWPNGAKGPIPQKRSSTDLTWSDLAAEYFALPALMQTRILTLVNEHRIEHSLPPIPTQSPEYITYMNATTHDRAFDQLSLSTARLSEDRRVTGLMIYWNELLSERKLTLSALELNQILLSTRRDPTEQPPCSEREKPLTYTKMPWDHICLKAPKNRIVRQALLSDNPYLIEAICVIFYQLRDSRDSWSTEATEDTILKLMDRFQNDPALSTKIQEQQNVK